MTSHTSQHMEEALSCEICRPIILACKDCKAAICCGTVYHDGAQDKEHHTGIYIKQQHVVITNLGDGSQRQMFRRDKDLPVWGKI